jgi:hypothetical protein
VDAPPALKGTTASFPSGSSGGSPGSVVQFETVWVRSFPANPGRTNGRVDTGLESPVSLDLGLSGGVGELAVVADPEMCGIRDPLGAARLPPDPFALLDVSLEGFRPSEASYRLATSLAVSIDGAAILDEQVGSVAVAPEPDLRTFVGSRGQVFFAASFLAAATSDEANVRRGMPLDAAVRRDYARWDASNGHVFVFARVVRRAFGFWVRSRRMPAIGGCRSAGACS